MNYLDMELWGVASLMALFSIYLLYLVKKGIDGIPLIIVIYLAGSMISMFLPLSYYFSAPTITNLATVLASSSGYMILGLIPIVYLITKNSKPKLRDKWFAIGIFTAIMAISEASMGQAFYSIIYHSFGNLLLGVQNYWYQATMVAEMLFTLAYGFTKLDRGLRSLLLFTLPVMAVSPAIIDVKSYVFTAVWISASFMIIATVAIYEILYKERLRASSYTFTAIELMIVYALMMSGEFVYYLTGSWYVYDFAMLSGMFWFIYRGIQGPSSIKGSYIKDQKLAFSIIALTFVMEWFMGGVLDFEEGVLSPGVSGFISSLSLGFVSPLSYFGLGSLFDFLSIFGTVTGSAWFLVMMGTEMGLLAAFRIKELKNKENKIRFLLMIGAFAIYTVYLPSFSPISNEIQYIPYMWSMGLGTNGPVTSSVLLSGIIGTYAVSAILSFMFGSRQICSVTCSAPLMYQGTFYDSTKAFNRKSSLGRKTLTSKLKPWFKFIILGVWATYLASAVLSYLNSLNLISFSIFGNDATVFLYSFFFNFLWYVVFISIPFMGTYACATQGWCSWGSFNQAVSSIGFWRLKARDPSVCLNCKTVDCAKACPVGLTDMRASFMKKGEFKSFKCIGVGDCVEACPHDNILFYDVRHWLRDKIRKKEKQSKVG
ncbi:4Fe-4S binding protein [Sulfuracidifex tepidarius]|nr:4Fe-4S binding protein [Sulfuracidifex tepidarius]